ncbi:hypothetical protein AQPE_4354 [Aquipluma nitroreducens]|uniref:Uncharacterized protein n=1 Tax=Aquipluma nitroreducens TaxID=2010828 RepID=A0A5K7SF37_9BACT|nr:hypothetical protein [Aquipluma nitroreducens]BBE20163.1 hypothetical protein AQPE_4354 [Aquipluma nitroreducens]
MKRITAANDTYSKVAVLLLNQVFYIYQKLLYVDSEVLLICHLQVAASRW